MLTLAMTGHLEPMANVFAALPCTLHQAEELRARIAATGELSLRHSSDRWVVGVAPLPNGPPEPAELWSEGLLFAQGRERLIDHSLDRVRKDARKIAELTRRSPERLGQLGGDFGFLCFEGETVTVVRSCGGRVPFYFHQGSDGSVAVATRLDYFPRLLGRAFELDPLVATLAGLWALNPDRRTFLRDVSVVPRGSFTQIQSERSVRTGRYWDPRPRPGVKLEASEEHPHRLRRLLLEALDRELAPGAGNLMALSGGVDSSSLAALATGVLGLDCAALTMLPKDPRVLETTLGYLEPLCDRYGLAPHWRIVLDPDNWLELIQRPQAPILHALHPNLCVLPAIAEQHDVRVLVGGEAADELIGSPLNLADWYDHTSMIELIRGGFRTMPYGPRRILGWTKRRALRIARRIDIPYPSELPRYLRPGLASEYQEWRQRRRSEARRDRRPLLAQTLWYEHDGWVAMNWEACSSVGVRRSLPFYTREAQELAFSCHPRELIGPGDKKLLRAALKDDVPHRNLFRKDKGGDPPPAPGAFALAEPLPSSLDQIVDESWLDAPPSRLDLIEAVGLAHLVALDRRLQLANRAGSEAAQLGDRAGARQ